jgi:hypothetical protein
MRVSSKKVVHLEPIMVAGTTLKESLKKIDPSLAEQVVYSYEEEVRSGPPDVVLNQDTLEELTLDKIKIRYFPLLGEAILEVKPDPKLQQALGNTSPEKKWDYCASEAMATQGINADQVWQKNYQFPISSSADLDKLMGTVFSALRGENAGDSVLDKLISAGIPEEAILGNQELWDYMQKVERNEIVSANKNFYVTDSNGEKLLLKISDNKTKAKIEAAANYYLGNHFNFIIPGKSPKPIEANGLYMTLQKDVSDEVLILKPLEYWISSLALFHRDAEKILKENNVEVKDKKLRSAEEIKEMYSRGRGVHDLGHFNESELEDVVKLLEETEQKAYIHGDLKNGNRHSSYLVDLEGCGKGHPGIDLSMLFMQYNLPQEQWDDYLNMYLEVKGVESSFDQELNELREGVEKAAIYTATKEVVGSSLREVREDTARDNRLLASYLN